MPVVKLTDVIVPEVFTDYVTNQTTEKSALIQSGIVQRTTEFDTLASGPGKLMEMPYWNDLSDQEATSVHEDDDLTPKNITTGTDQARKLMRAEMWGENNLSAHLSATDPLAKIAELVSNYWVRQDQLILLNMLSGVFAASNMSTNVHSIVSTTGSAGVLAGENFLDAQQKLGDAKNLLTAVMMNSYVETFLRKLNLIEYVPLSEQGAPIPFFMGHRVIVDDAMAFNTTTGVGSMYLFGAGAIAQGEGSDPKIVATEVTRDPKNSAGTDYLINRRIQLFHPRGVKWTDSTVAKTFPTNTELATAANWNRIYDPKKIRIVKFDFNTIPQA